MPASKKSHPLYLAVIYISLIDHFAPIGSLYSGAPRRSHKNHNFSYRQLNLEYVQLVPEFAQCKQRGNPYLKLNDIDMRVSNIGLFWPEELWSSG